MNSTKYKNIMYNIGACMVASCYFVLVFMFLLAYFDPSKTCTLSINSFNEAHIELIIITGTLPASIKVIKKALGKPD